MRARMFLLFILLMASLQAQTTYYVNGATGNDDNDGSEATPWATLNPEKWAAGTDDCIINVAPGEYFINGAARVEVNAQILGTSQDEVILMGEGDEDFWDDSRGEYPTTEGAFLVPEGSTLTIKNLTLKNQRRADAWGGSIKVEWGATLNLENVDFLNSIVLAGGGGAVDCDGTLNCTNVLFQGCFGPSSVISLFTNDERSDDGTVRANFENTRFIENESYNELINMEATKGIDVGYNNCLFLKNKTASYGVILRFGVYTDGMYANANITNSAFIENSGEQAGCMAIYTDTEKQRTVDFNVSNCTFYKNLITGYHSTVFTINGMWNDTMTGNLIFVNNTLVDNGNFEPEHEATAIAIPDITLNMVFVNNIAFSALPGNISFVLWDEANPSGGAYRTVVAQGNFVDKVGGADSQIADFKDPMKNTIVGGEELNNDGELVYVEPNATLKLKTELTYPSVGAPYFELQTGSIAIDKGHNEVTISGKNIVPQKDVRGKAIVGDRKDVGVFEYDPDEQSSIAFPAVNNEDILLYPNPFNETIFLKKEVNKVEIFNAAGIKFLSVINPTLIEASTWPKGIYFIRIIGMDGSINTVKMAK